MVVVDAVEGSYYCSVAAGIEADGVVVFAAEDGGMEVVRLIHTVAGVQQSVAGIAAAAVAGIVSAVVS